MNQIEVICALGATIASLDALSKKPRVSKKRLREIIEFQKQLLTWLNNS